MQWHTQAGKITNNMKVKICFTSPEFSAKNIVTWNCHVDDPTKGRYNMILGRDIWPEIEFNLGLSEYFITKYDGTLKG